MSTEHHEQDAQADGCNDAAVDHDAVVWVEVAVHTCTHDPVAMANALAAAHLARCASCSAVGAGG